MRAVAESKVAEIIGSEIPEVVHVPSPSVGAMMAEAIEVTKATVTATGEIKVNLTSIYYEIP